MLPTLCPSCQARLKVTNLQCEHCGTEIKSNYELPILTLLTAEEQSFVLQFVKNSGSLKQMAALLHLSYPTVRNMLNEIISKIESYEN